MYVWTLPCKRVRVKIVTKQCNFTLLLAETRGLRQKQSTVCSKHIIHLFTLLP